MNTTNKVQLTGNLGANPEIKNFDNGNKVARFSMATKLEYKTKNGEKVNKKVCQKSFKICIGKEKKRPINQG